ncbi:prolyl-tRNA synthetase [Patescibacteria group bacterium]|nr:prolyl-tRNA synthetase [Patescibacteria group bacterium]
MRHTGLFTKTRREAPSDEVAKNAQLLIRAGYVHKEMAGVYAYLPLGLRVLQNIINIIRQEMNGIGGQEVTLTALQDPEVWKKSGRWSDEAVDIWFKTQLKNGGELGLGNTHEEPLTALMTEHISSYKDLPKYVYQFQTKFRNETRAKSGIMRSREFVMKDLYSFSKNDEEFRTFYEKCAEAYLRIFARVGIGAKTYRTFASGGSFSKFSDEFQTVCDAGEDIIYIHEGKKLAVNKEVYTDEVLKDLDMKKEDMVEAKAIEVGNIFPLGTKYSEPLGLTYTDETGKKVPVVMGSYGIGPGRLMGTIVELLSDEKGIVWPEAVAPFAFHLLSLGSDNEQVEALAEKVYERLCYITYGENVKLYMDNVALYDDRKVQTGEKRNDADLIGIPYQIIVGKKSIESGLMEVVKRATGETFTVGLNDFFEAKDSRMFMLSAIESNTNNG